MHFYEQFRFCPVCGASYSGGSFEPQFCSFLCKRCSYRFYQNSRPSASTVIPLQGSPDRVLVMTRAAEPGLGQLALPGGFLDYAEEPASAAEREAFEETGLRVRACRLLCSTMVDYTWRGARISVVELAYLMSPVEISNIRNTSEEASCLAFHAVDELISQPSRLAFPGHADVLISYRNQLSFSVPSVQPAEVG